MSRQDKIAEAIKQEASVIIHDKLKDPRLGFVTITNVEITRDLRFAKIFFSVFGNEMAYKMTKADLNSSLGVVRKLIAQRLSLRFAPEIAFYDDRSTEYSVRIEEVLNELKEKNEQAKPKKSSRSDKEA